MKEPYGEGLATHAGPESCVGAREDVGEALTGAHAGWVLSRERLGNRGADPVGQWGRQHGGAREWRAPYPVSRGRRPHARMEASRTETGRSPVWPPLGWGGPHREGRRGRSR